MIKGVFPPIPEHFSPELSVLINSMLSVNPKKRLSSGQLLDHPIFKKRDAKYYGTGTMMGSREPSLESNENFSVNFDITGATSSRENRSVLLKTIKLPRNLKLLSSRLPKATYEDTMDSLRRSDAVNQPKNRS